MAFAKIMLIGNVGRDPEMRYTPSGKAVTEVSVAVGYSKRDPSTQEWIDEGTDWFRVSIWGERGERVAETVRKGHRVFVEGRLRTRSYEGRDGQQRTALEVSADNVISLDRRAADGDTFGDAVPASAQPRPPAQVPPQQYAQPVGAPAPRPAATPAAGSVGYADLDDLPF